MTNKQDSLIYVEKEDKQEATFMSVSFVSNSVRNRAYLNALGAELIKKYLVSEGIKISSLYNIHSVSKVLEKTDVSDILLDNIHIDVRVIFDENQIFVPKSHFDLEILPDVYAVVKFDADFECAKFLGYFTPSEFDKDLQNNQYYFIERSKLSSPEDFGKFVKEFSSENKKRELTENDFERGRFLSVALADHNISDEEYKEFLDLMLQNPSLREEVLEFDNFETLSYNTIPLLEKKHEEATIEQFFGGTDDFEGAEVSETQEKASIVEDEILPLKEAPVMTAPTLPIEKMKSASVDDLIDAKIAAIDTPNEPQNANNLASGIATAAAIAGASAVAAATVASAEKVVEDVSSAVVEGAVSGVVDAVTAENSSENKPSSEVEKEEVKDEEIAENPASDEAIKLAGVSGDIIEEVIEDNVEKQNKNLDKIDYKKTDIYTDTNDIPENVVSIADVAPVQREDVVDDTVYETPKNLEDLEAVEQKVEENFVHETTSFDDMDVVNSEDFGKIVEDDSEMFDLSNVDVTAEIGNEQNSETISLDDVATSNFDDLATDINFNDTMEDNLVDLDTNLSSLAPKNELEEEASISKPETTDFDIVDENLENELDIQDELSVSDVTQDLAADLSLDEEEREDENVIIPQEEEKDEEETAADLENFFDEKLAEDDNLNISDEIDLVENEDSSSIIDETPISSEDEEFAISEDVNPENVIDETSIQEVEDFGMGENLEGEETIEEGQTSENTETDWLTADDYSELQDVEETSENIEPTEIIEETSEEKKEFVVAENSTVISDKNFNVGEISIDINNPEIDVTANQNIEQLYAAGEDTESLLQNSGRVPSSAAVNRKLPLGLGIAGVLISLALVGAIGFGVSKMLKPSADEPQPLTDEPLTGVDNDVNNSNTLDVNPENVVDMDKAAPIAQPKKAVQDVAPAKPATSVSQPVSTQKTNPTTFIEIRKLTWEVPDYVSYNSQFKQFFQSAGKSLKLALSSDLLLATDYVYTSSIRVSLTFNKDGSFKTAAMVNSSGSSQIDKIVLQTVNQTLTSLKAPHSIGNDESTTVILKIYF